MLGDPNQIRCLAGGREMRLAELGLSPLDAIYATESEWKERLPDAEFSRDPQWPPAILSFDEFFGIAEALRSLLAKARPLTGADLGLPDQKLPDAIDAAELTARADRAVEALRNAAPASMAFFGMKTVLEKEERLKKLAKVTDAEERLKVVFGAGFLVLPRFVPSNATEIAVAFGNSDALQRNRRLEVVTWFTRAARVREGLSRLADVLRFAEVWGRNTPGFTVGQMPFVPGEVWVALPTAGTSPGGRLSLVACGSTTFEGNQPLAGFVWDEWSEVVPNRAETTAMAFHYDRPNSRPPQAILIAVAPDVNQPWNLLFIEQILRETLSLSKQRLVDQDAMLELDQYLPALCFPINAAGDTIATDLRAR
jgi:hypothetical protein